MMDGFVHIIPLSALHKHWLATDCWCDPRVVWPEDGETIVVSHRHLKAPEVVHG